VSQCYCGVQNSFPCHRKALMRGSYEMLYRLHMRTFLPGVGSGTVCGRTAAVRGCVCRV